MNTSQVSQLLGILTILALAVSALALAAMVGKRDWLARFVTLAIPAAFLVAAISTLGSLYYSGVAHFTPCRLCWWQRIFMYPQVIILGIAAMRRSRDAALYSLTLSLIGFGHSLYHAKLQWFPGDSDTCSIEAPCSAKWVEVFGFISIPVMAAAAFLAIATLSGSVLLVDGVKVGWRDERQ